LAASPLPYARSKVTDDPGLAIHDPAWLRDHVSLGNVCNLLADEAI
jgi:hypothetical protein